MACTEMQSKDASKIAYLSTLSSQNANWTGDGNPSVKQLILQSLGKDPYENISYEEFSNLVKDSDLPDKDTILEVRADALEWKYLADMDTNTENGFFGCALETGDNEAIVAFRGSQSFTSYENAVHDWGDADLKLLQGQTVQDRQVEAFAELLNGKLGGYSIDVAGHSLGGELATHFTIHCCEKYPDMYDRIVHCYNLDGPGRDDSYIEEHASSIAVAKDKITNYAVAVEAMLNPIGEVVPVKVMSPEEAAKRDGVPCSPLYRIIYGFKAHSLDYWEADPNDPESFPRGTNTSLVYKIFHKISNAIDGTPWEEPLIFAYDWVFKYIIEEGPDGGLKLTPYGVEFIAKTCGVLGAIIVAADLVDVALVAVAVVAALILEDKLEQLLQEFDKIIEIVADEMKKKLGELKQQIDKVKNEFIKNWSSIKDNLRTIINPAYNYASNNPYIKVNTSELRDYAYRIKQINETIKGLDYRLDLLYYNAGLLDVLNLMQADIILGYSYRLSNCESYLNETADAFERAEANIMNL